MLERVLIAVRSARPRMTLRARAVIEAVVLSKGSIGTAQSVARALGLTNRFQLARLLEREGLPPLHRMREWITVLNWLQWAERQQVSLCWIAFRSHRHPSACYRLVKQVTGLGWETLLGRGSAWALSKFLEEVHRRRAPDYVPESRQMPPIASWRRSHARARSPLSLS